MGTVNDKKTKEKALFKRILKEIGLYNHYKECRKLEIENNLLRARLSIDNMSSIPAFSTVLDSTLTWCYMPMPDLLCDLYDKVCGMDCKDIIRNEKLLDELRKIVKKHNN